LWNTEAKEKQITPKEKKKQQPDTQVHTPVFTHLDTLERKENRVRRTTYIYIYIYIIIHYLMVKKDDEQKK